MRVVSRSLVGYIHFEVDVFYSNPKANRIFFSAVNFLCPLYSKDYNINDIGKCSMMRQVCLEARHGFFLLTLSAVFFSFPHISVDSAGQVGKISRPNRPGESCACGALSAVSVVLHCYWYTLPA
jgi:hypothetical protein